MVQMDNILGAHPEVPGSSPDYSTRSPGGGGRGGKEETGEKYGLVVFVVRRKPLIRIFQRHCACPSSLHSTLATEFSEQLFVKENCVDCRIAKSEICVIAGAKARRLWGLCMARGRCKCGWTVRRVEE